MRISLMRLIPKRVRNFFRAWRRFLYARAYLRDWEAAVHVPAAVTPGLANPLRAYVNGIKTGPGVWKWDHYFDIYHRHFEKFRGREVHILEIGVFSGGSLGMWRHYFGPQCRVYGVDIDPACKAYEQDAVRIFIGDQGDRDFWRRLKEAAPRVDIVVDDGSHLTSRQIVTLEEMLPHIAPGGIFLCEDVHGIFNGFSLYASGFANELNAAKWRKRRTHGDQREPGCDVTLFQAMVRSIHLYPWVVVFEKHDMPPAEFVSPRHGTEWRPNAPSL